jgi:CMP-N-acetylneuraminic acid synthetase
MKLFTIIKEHSTRINNKNFAIVNGSPLWMHLIQEVKGEPVFIDTDSDKVVKECESIDNVTAYKRLARHIELENCPDFKNSPVLLMINRFLDEYVSDDNEIIVNTHITSPFLKLKTIKDASTYIGKHSGPGEKTYDSVQSCTVHREFAYYQDKPINFDSSVVSKTQDLDPIVFSSGAFFIFTKKTFKEHKNRVGKRCFFYPLDFEQSIEIDYPEDLKLARIWANGNN